MSVTAASAALTELIASMKKLDQLQDDVRGRDMTDAEDKLWAQLENRISGLGDQLQSEVKAKLGVDYVVLWHAVTPSASPPMRGGRWL